jgi:geranylgeranyl transferase type-1 subunit beta
MRARYRARNARQQGNAPPFVTDSHDVRTRHYFEMLIRGLPRSVSGFDMNRMTVLLFALNSLDCLGVKLAPKTRDYCIDWIYARQCSTGGFDGSSFHAPFPRAHLVSTYSAVVCLAILRDDLTRLRKRELASFIGGMQSSLNGGFCAEEEAMDDIDARFVYCACALVSMLNLGKVFDETKCVSFLEACQAYDGGFGMQPGLESHGGGCYTCLASFALLKSKVPNRDAVVQFLCGLQQAEGFAGRTQKVEDTCYGFWVGAALCMVQGEMDGRRLGDFLNKTAHMVGGYGKAPGDFPDPLHSHFGLFARVIAEGRAKHDLDVVLGMTKPTSQWLAAKMVTTR